jgi:hypothetical protein
MLQDIIELIKQYLDGGYYIPRKRYSRKYGGKTVV